MMVPKVHPLTRGNEPDDPLELRAEGSPGDAHEMLSCLLQEFAWMGYDADQLEALFHHPGYPLLVQLRDCLGDAAVRNQIHMRCAAGTVPQFREWVAEPDHEQEPDVVQIEGIDAAKPVTPWGDPPERGA